jgi:hypothetical protein
MTVLLAATCSTLSVILSHVCTIRAEASWICDCVKAFPQSFIHQYAMSPMKTSTQELKLKYIPILKLKIYRRGEYSENSDVLMQEFRSGSSMMYHIKWKLESLRRVLYETDSDKSIDQWHTLQTLTPEDLDLALYDWFSLKTLHHRDMHLSLDKW